MQQMFRPLRPNNLIRSILAPARNHYLFERSRSLSSGSDAVQDQFTVSYLVKSCGLSFKSAKSASKKVHLETLDKPNAVISLLKVNDFSTAQIAKLVASSPSLLDNSSESALLTKIDFFKSKGFSGSEIAKVMCSCPTLLTRSLENQIVPAYDALRKVCQSDYRTIVVLRTYPYYLVRDVDGLLARNCSILYDIGVSQSSILKLLIANPWVLAMNPDDLKKVATKLIDEIGIDPSKQVFFQALGVIAGLKSSKWESKLNMFKQEWNLSEEQVLAGFRKYPKLMALSEEKVNKAMKLLVDELGWEPSFIIITQSKLLGYSVEKRLIPRASVLLHLVSTDSMKKESLTPQVFAITDDVFLHKYVNNHREAPLLLKLFTSIRTLENECADALS